MWVKGADLRAWPYMVNLDKVHSIVIHGDAEAFTVKAYLDDGGFRNIAHQTGFNKAVLFSGTFDECQEYMDWLVGEMNTDYWVVERKQKEV